jgi:hypothetical protein
MIIDEVMSQSREEIIIIAIILLFWALISSAAHFNIAIG